MVIKIETVTSDYDHIQVLWKLWKFACDLCDILW